MKGTILDFSIAENQGAIAGDDGTRYTFVGKDWKAQTPPQAGVRIDFEANGSSAVSIYTDVVAVTTGAGATGTSTSSDTGFYRSSDEKILAGVCGGLAHKWKFNRTGLRVAVFCACFFWIPFFAYIAMWIILPAKPTKNIS